MSSSQKNGRKVREDREKHLKLKQRYEHRITVAKQGKAAFQSGDFSTSLRRYMDYLGVHAEINKCDIYSVRPDMFNPKKELSEMLAISQIYFEMAKQFDLSKKYEGECIKALDRYVAFSANQPYQVVNSEVLRKTLRKGKLKRPQHFYAAYKQIQTKSAKCFIATYYFGEEDEVTQKLRLFKNKLLSIPSGFFWVDLYYRFSPQFISFSKKHRPLDVIFKKTLKPLLRWFSSLF
jgi:hypothetical protein